MLARMAGMPSATCSTPVTAPVSMPTAKAAAMAAAGLHPARISITATAPPVAIEPSTVRSATSKILKVRYTPSAIRPQMMPCAQAPGIARKSAIGSSMIFSLHTVYLIC